MRRTLAQLESWRGREALDAQAEPVGDVAATFVGEANGAPRWLAIQTGAHGDDVSLVPIDGAEPTGSAIRLAYPAEMIRAALHLSAGAELSTAQDEQLVAYYAGGEPAPPAPRAPGPGPGADHAVIAALRAIHALEREALARLRGLRAALADAELSHDVGRHLRETEAHEAGVAARLAELDSPRSGLRNVVGVLSARTTAVKAKVASADVATLLRGALDFERREREAYFELAGVARSADDGRSRRLAERNGADELAMAETLTAALRRIGEAV